MTRLEMQQHIERAAARAKTDGQICEIDRLLPTVSIDRSPDDWFFFQGQEAVELLESIADGCMEFEVSEEDFLLWSAQGW